MSMLQMSVLSQEVCKESHVEKVACGAATVLTSTPHKQQLEEFQKKSLKVPKQAIVKGRARRALGLDLPKVSPSVLHLPRSRAERSRSRRVVLECRKT